MKKKILIIIIIGITLSIIIYLYTKKEELNIVSLGDGTSLGMTPYNIEGLSYNDYLINDYKEMHKLNNYYDFSEFGKSIKELIYEIKENKTKEIKGEEIEIQRAMNEASILTISIGMDEISEDKITKETIINYEDDIKELLSMIKMLNHNKVIVIGLYTIKKEEYLNIAKMNAILRDAAISNHFIFIDISDLQEKEEYYLDNKSYYMNYLGHKKIYEKIKKEIKK